MNSIRKKVVAANWKMNTTITQGEKLADEILTHLPGELNCSVIIAPPFTHLPMLVQKVKGTRICIAAQNCHQERSGAFTGEISVDMLSDLGINYVIIGHSERRQLFHENNEIVKLKLNAVLAAGLLPIFCCGEPLDIRDSATQNIFVHQQLEESLFHLNEDEVAKVCIAYEPIWAIGTGVTASPEQAQEMHMFIRDKIAVRYNKIVSETTKILYGGSIKADNAKTLFSQDDVDGGLVGGASLSSVGFLDIVRAACG
ncbi:MAG: triose-phosphate isomerase [Saprospiraceae bacterium]